MNSNLYRYIIYLLLISLLFTGISFSRFSTTLTNEITGEPTGTTVSDPIILYVPRAGLADENNNKILTLNDMCPDLQTQSYYFKIVNFSGGDVSDTAFHYTIDIETLGALPLSFEIYDMDNECYLTLTRNTTSQVFMPKDVSKTHNYRLDISWGTGNSNADDYRYSDEIDYINIIVDAQQAQ